jgi:hypothetical protein
VCRTCFSEAVINSCQSPALMSNELSLRSKAFTPVRICCNLPGSMDGAGTVHTRGEGRGTRSGRGAKVKVTRPAPPPLSTVSTDPATAPHTRTTSHLNFITSSRAPLA